MVDQDFLSAGFHEFSPSRFEHDGVETCFQKRYDDDHGKKYFITVNKWRAWEHPYTHEIFPSDYEYHIQMYKKDDHGAIDILFHSSWNLVDVENYMEKLWDTGLFDYYECFTE